MSRGPLYDAWRVAEELADPQRAVLRQVTAWQRRIAAAREEVLASGAMPGDFRLDCVWRRGDGGLRPRLA
jgi:hypothetical protein